MRSDSDFQHEFCYQGFQSLKRFASMPLFMHIQSWVHISLQIASLHVVQNHPLCIYDMFWSTLGLISCANIEMACIHASVKVASNQLKSIAKDMSMRNDQWRTCANYFRSKFTIAFCLKSLVMQTIPQLQCLPKRSLQGTVMPVLRTPPLWFRAQRSYIHYKEF